MIKGIQNVGNLANSPTSLSVCSLGWKWDLFAWFNLGQILAPGLKTLIIILLLVFVYVAGSNATSRVLSAVAQQASCKMIE